MHRSDVIAFKPIARRLFDLIPAFRRLRQERDTLRQHLSAISAVPPGHFYSPIPDFSEIRKKESSLFGQCPTGIPAIDLNEKEQQELLRQLLPYYQEMPFKESSEPGLHYWLRNGSFEFADGILLYMMLRHLRPARFIEVGCGHSSCLLIDTNRMFFDNAIECTFVDPYPEALLSLIPGDVADGLDIIRKPVQDLPLSRFQELRAGDVLFVDSSHVSKIGSDVNHLVFHVLPALAPGVFVHFHDVIYPFEYYPETVFAGRTWNEAYLIRAFLQYNSTFRIAIWNSWLDHFCRESIEKDAPLWLHNWGGSIWLEKL